MIVFGIVLAVAVIGLFVWLLVREIKNPATEHLEESVKPGGPELQPGQPTTDDVPEQEDAAEEQPTESEQPKTEAQPTEPEQPTTENNPTEPEQPKAEEKPTVMDVATCIDAFDTWVTVPAGSLTRAWLTKLYNEAVEQYIDTGVLSSNGLPMLWQRRNFPTVYDYWRGRNDSIAAFNTAVAWLFALQLAELKPRRRNQIFKVGYELGGHTMDAPVFGYEFDSDPNVARLVASAIYAAMRGMYRPDIMKMREEVGGTGYVRDLSYYLDLGLNHLKTAEDILHNVESNGGFYADLRLFMPSSAGPFATGYHTRPSHAMADERDDYDNTVVDRRIHEYIVGTYNLDAQSEAIRQMTVQAIADKEQSILHLYGKDRQVGEYMFHPVFGEKTIGKLIPASGATGNLTFYVQAISTYFRLILQNHADSPAYYGRLRPGCSWTTEKQKNSEKDDRRNILVEIAIEDNDGQKTSTYGYYDTDGLWKHKAVDRDQYAEAQKCHLGANSYPSGHSSGIWTVAMMLMEAMPERADLIMQAANQFAVNRTISRFHWTSDTIYGRVLGSVASALCHATADYDLQLEAVRKEVARC